jgi:hypothetical protein
MSLPSRCGKAWSSEEIQQLLKEVRRKETHNQIASTHERTVGGIRARLKGLAADYYFNDNRPLEEIMKFTGLDSETISDAISKRQYEIDMKEKKEKMAPILQTTLVGPTEIKKEGMISLLTEIRDMMKEMLEILKKD